MKIIDFDRTIDKNYLAQQAHEICTRAAFPVDYQDVYNHLFEKENLILKLLINKTKSLAGFGVFEIFEEELNTMLYLSGMVIDKKYQGYNISREIIRKAYQEVNTNLVSLRTQNIAMAKSLLTTFPNKTLEIPKDINSEIIDYLRKITPFENIEENSVIKNCYPNQLYHDLNAIKENFDIEINSNDALVVAVAPKNQKILLKSKK